MHYPIDCVLYNNNYEDSILILLECPSAMHIWREVNLWDKIDRALRQNYNMDAMISNMLSTLSPTQSALFATVTWSILKRRNLRLRQHKTETNIGVFTRATTLLEDHKSTQIIRKHGRTTSAANH